MADAFLRSLGNVENPGNATGVYVFPGGLDSRSNTSLQGDGLQVCMRAIRGMTDPDVLKRPFYFQCPPTDTFTRSYSYSFTDYNTISRGQFSRPSGVDLATITFTTLFVDFDAAWANLRANPGGSTPNPVAMVQELTKVLRRGTPFELIVGQRALWGTNDVHWAPTNGNAATLRTLDVEERAGEIDARYVNVAFTEFRTAELARKGEGKGDGTNKDPKRGRNLPASVTIAADSKLTLTKLSSTYYGTTSEWKSIAKRNGISSWQQNRSLGDWVKSQGDKRRTIVVPEIETTITITGHYSTGMPAVR